MLRVRAFRGEQVAAGVVVLVVLVLVLNVRFDGRWGDGWLLGLTAAAAVLSGRLAFAVERRGDGPRGWETTLLVGWWLLSAGALVRLVDVVSSDVGPGVVAVVSWVLAGLAALMALRGAATGTFLWAAAGGGWLLAFVEWVGSPGAGAYRVMLAAIFGACTFLALGSRDRRPHHAAQLANVAALAVLAIAAVELVDGFFAPFAPVKGSSAGERLGWGWELLLLVAGFGAIAYGAVDRHRGPVLLGAALLASFVALQSDGDLLGWPSLLAVAAGAFLLVGLRPFTELPPEPGSPSAPVEPLRP